MPVGTDVGSAVGSVIGSVVGSVVGSIVGDTVGNPHWKQSAFEDGENVHVVAPFARVFIVASPE